MENNNLAIELRQFEKIVDGSWMNLDKNSSKKIITRISTDSRFDCTGAMFIALSGDIFDGHNFIPNAIEKNASAICVNKDRLKKLNIPENLPVLLVDNTYKAYQDIARYHRLSLKDITIIGLTGSNGKTSTKDILYSILSSEFGKDKVYATKANTNNHVGVPQNLLNLNTGHRYAIIEMGSNHPGEIKVLAETAKPDIALLTTIGPSHLEFFGDLHGVAMEKKFVFSCFNKNKVNSAVLPYDCPEKEILTNEIPNSIPIKTFGYNSSADLKVEYLSGNLYSSKFSLIWQNKKYDIESTLTGKHQILNAAGASLVADILGVPRENIAKHLSNPVITGMRMRIKKYGSVTWINDAYNANPASTNAGLDFIKETIQNDNKINKTYLVLGDMLELGESSLSEHIKVLQKACTINNAVICTVGSIMGKAVDSISNEKIIRFKDKDKVVSFLTDNIKQNDLIYLKSSNGTGLRLIEEKINVNNIKKGL